MLKYAKIIDPEKGICQVGTGDPEALYQIVTDEDGKEKTLYVSDFYKSLGMEEMDVEEGHDGNWYIFGFAPAPPETRTVRTFSKFSIWAATQQMQITLEDGTKTTVWAEFEKFMANTILPSGTTLLSGWFQLNDLVEDNPFFEEFYPLACEKLGKELVDQVLAASVTATKEVEA